VAHKRDRIIPGHDGERYPPCWPDVRQEGFDWAGVDHDAGYTHRRRRLGFMLRENDLDVTGWRWDQRNRQSRCGDTGMLLPDPLHRGVDICSDAFQTPFASAPRVMKAGYVLHQARQSWLCWYPLATCGYTTHGVGYLFDNRSLASDI
jgi:hypothetical protein